MVLGALAAAATVAATPATAGARPTTVAVTLAEYPLVCGRPTAATIRLAFPRAERLPARIAAGTVRVAHGHVQKVDVAGHRIAVAVSPTRPGEVICQTITTGELKLTFTRAARLGNPSRAGTYAVTVRHGAETATARLRITARN